MSDNQTTSNNRPIERVPYNRTISRDHNNTAASASVIARPQPDGETFPVRFDTTRRESVASLDFLHTHFPSARISPHIPPPADGVDVDLSSIRGSADIAIYIPGSLEIPFGLRVMGNATFRYEDWIFQFDLRVRVLDHSAERGLLLVGSDDMKCFSLALRDEEKALILRPNDDLANRGIMPFMVYM